MHTDRFVAWPLVVPKVVVLPGRLSSGLSYVCIQVDLAMHMHHLMPCQPEPAPVGRQGVSQVDDAVAKANEPPAGMKLLSSAGHTALSHAEARI